MSLSRGEKLKTGFVYHEIYMWHNTGNNADVMPYGNPVQPGIHIENPETKRRFHNLLEVSGLLPQLEKIIARPVTESQLLRYHTPKHLARVKKLSEGDGGDGGYFSPIGRGSYEIAMLSTGGVISAVDAVLNGDVKNAYALVRPPGHHALADSAMGFCMFANAVLAGLHALEARGLKRIAVVDWDVHHGNGTQAGFWEDPRALTISIHQDQCFPSDSGFTTEVGAGEGEGYNINIPLPAGSGVGAYEAAFDRVVIPALQTYKPDLIFVPSGFDAGAHDPLGRMQMHSEGYRNLTRKIMKVADEVCDGRIVMCHEGGYNAATVPFFGLAVMEELSGLKTNVVDPFYESMAALGGQELQPHQADAISSAEALLKNLTR
ncbi:class II histone deacetylase [Dasania sp. GY-MA-18]|uniref:class II histone deacetylase n=1 Tax=Dasania sp. GY-MA-18 TaxID=2966584 RepID=UPI0021AC4E17|nr:class II histone deacetylase [Dasania sp. GY-MA-18]MCR8924366.1 class II histone deacetylase [Dasania sp. GY-MA-18]